MTKRKRVIHILLAVICLAAIVVGLIYYQNQGKKHIQKSYFRQNTAFTVCNDLFTSYRDETDQVYHGYQDVQHETILYAYLRLYEHDTGHTLTLEDVQNYLSAEYNENGSLRLSEQFPEIQGYIDFIWNCTESYPEKDADKIDYLTLYEMSLRDGLKIRCGMPYPYYIGNIPQPKMEMAIEWAFDVSDEQKAKGYVFARDIRWDEDSNPQPGDGAQ